MSTEVDKLQAHAATPGRMDALAQITNECHTHRETRYYFEFKCGQNEQTTELTSEMRGKIHRKEREMSERYNIQQI